MADPEDCYMNNSGFLIFVKGFLAAEKNKLYICKIFQHQENTSCKNEI